MREVGKRVLMGLVIMTILILENGIVAQAKTSQIDIFVGYAFDYKHQGQTLYYQVLSKASGSQPGTLAVEAISNENLIGDVIIPDTITYGGDTYKVTYINNGGFDNCYQLRSIVLPDSITSLGDYAFRDCDELDTITIPVSVKKIGKYAFASSDNLSQINIPEGIININEGVFYNCDSLINITLPESVTSIGSEAFKYCNNLININIPESVTRIGVNAFYECTKLTTINIPAGIEKIGKNAFFECTNLADIYILENLISYVEYEFSAKSNNVDLIYEVINDANEIESGTVMVKGNSSNIYASGTIVIPSKVIYDGLEYKVTSINDYAFENCTKITELEIPEGVTYIGYKAFYNCSSLTDFILPESIKTIGNEAFYGCKQLTEMKLPNNLTELGKSAFANCNSLSSISISQGLTTINERAFYYTNLKKVNLPTSIRGIGKQAFAGCFNLTSVNIPESVTKIEMYAFSGCNFTSITLPKNLTSIEAGVFANCRSLKGIILPEKIKSIGVSSFDRCTNLKSINIPKNVVSIGAYAFNECSSLPSISIPENTKSIGLYAFYGTKVEFNILKPATAKAISSGYNSNKISWSSVKGATGYQIYRATSATGKFSWLKNTASLSTSDTSLSTGKKYYYKVRAYKISGSNKMYSRYTIAVSATPTLAIPAKFNTTKTRSTSAKIFWNKVSGASRYQVYRATSKTGTYSYLKTTTSTSFSVTGLKTGKTYYYKVRAYRYVGSAKVFSNFTAAVPVYKK